LIDFSIIRCNLPDNLAVPRKSVEKRGVKRSTQKKPGVPFLLFNSKELFQFPFVMASPMHSIDEDAMAHAQILSSMRSLRLDWSNA
jgi:hypothetical protein